MAVHTTKQRKALLMARHRRVVVLLVAAVLFFVMIFSAFYISANTSHDCIDEHCSICSQINLYESMLKLLGLAFTICAIAGLAVAVYIGRVFIMHAAKEQDTLISLKVELLN